MLEMMIIKIFLNNFHAACLRIEKQTEPPQISCDSLIIRLKKIKFNDRSFDWNNGFFRPL